MDRKIPYYKNIKKDSKKQLGGGGPRDLQRKQDPLHEEITKLRELLEEKNPAPKVIVRDESQFLPFEEVRKKIQEAVEFTRKDESKRYESSLKNLNDQLKERKVELGKKDEIIARLSENYNESIDELKHKLDNIARRIVHGTISSEDPERPQINDKVFIDPIEGETELDSHITINAEKISGEKVDRNVRDDIKKLKHLLKTKKRND